MTVPPVRRSPVRTATVTANRALTPRMQRVSLVSDSLRGVPIQPAQDVELHLVDGTGRRVKRRYTLRNAEPEAGTFDLDVVLHGDWPGSSWGAAAAPGDEVRFQGPRGKLALTSADWHLLVGDESALPAVAAICEALPAAERAIAVIEVQDASDALPVAAQAMWLTRGAHPPGTPDLLVPAVEGLTLPDGRGHGYLMGETRSMVALRAVLEARGFDHDSIFVKGYWNLARPDRIAGKSPQ